MYQSNLTYLALEEEGGALGLGVEEGLDAGPVGLIGGQNIRECHGLCCVRNPITSVVPYGLEDKVRRVHEEELEAARVPLLEGLDEELHKLVFWWKGRGKGASPRTDTRAEPRLHPPDRHQHTHIPPYIHPTQPTTTTTYLDVEVGGLPLGAVHHHAHLLLDALESRPPRHGLQLLIEVHHGPDCVRIYK